MMGNILLGKQLKSESLFFIIHVRFGIDLKLSGNTTEVSNLLIVFNTVQLLSCFVFFVGEIFRYAGTFYN